MKTSGVRILLAASFLALLAPLAQAQDLGAIRSRMEQRVSKVDSLKASGVLGENNRGYLEVRSGSDEGLAAEENADRAAVYAAIAQKAGSTADAVGRARAKQIANLSAKGVWIQSSDGQWAKK